MSGKSEADLVVAALQNFANVANMFATAKLAEAKYEKGLEREEELINLKHKNSQEQIELRSSLSALKDTYTTQFGDIKDQYDKLDDLGLISQEWFQKLKGGQFETKEGESIFKDLQSSSFNSLITSIDEIEKTTGMTDTYNQAIEKNYAIESALNLLEKENKKGIALASALYTEAQKDYDIMFDDFSEGNLSRLFKDKFVDTTIDSETGEVKEAWNPAFHSFIQQFQPGGEFDIDQREQTQRVLNQMKATMGAGDIKAQKAIKADLKDAFSGWKDFQEKQNDKVIDKIKLSFPLLDEGFLKEHKVLKGLNDPRRLLSTALSTDRFADTENLVQLRGILKDNILSMARKGQLGQSDNEVYTMIFGYPDASDVSKRLPNVDRLLDYAISPQDEDGNYTETFEDAYSGWKGEEGLNVASYAEGNHPGLRYFDEATNSYPYKEVAHRKFTIEAQDYFVETARLYKYVDKIIRLNQITDQDVPALDDKFRIKYEIGKEMFEFMPSLSEKYIENLIEKYAPNEEKIIGSEYGLGLGEADVDAWYDFSKGLGVYGAVEPSDTLTGTDVDIDNIDIFQNR